MDARSPMETNFCLASAVRKINAKRRVKIARVRERRWGYTLPTPEQLLAFRKSGSARWGGDGTLLPPTAQRRPVTAPLAAPEHGSRARRNGSGSHRRRGGERAHGADARFSAGRRGCRARKPGPKMGAGRVGRGGKGEGPGRSSAGRMGCPSPLIDRSCSSGRNQRSSPSTFLTSLGAWCKSPVT